MSDPIITEAWNTAWSITRHDDSCSCEECHSIAEALTGARAEGRLAGMEEAARIAADSEYQDNNPDDRGVRLWLVVARNIAAAIRARTTKEG